MLWGQQLDQPVRPAACCQGVSSRSCSLHNNKAERSTPGLGGAGRSQEAHATHIIWPLVVVPVLLLRALRSQPVQAVRQVQGHVCDQLGRGAEQQQSRAGVRTTLNRRAAAAAAAATVLPPRGGPPPKAGHTGTLGAPGLAFSLMVSEAEVCCTKKLASPTSSSASSGSCMQNQGAAQQVRVEGREASEVVPWRRGATSDHPSALPLWGGPSQAVAASEARLTCSSRRRVITWQPRDMGGSSITFCSLGQVAWHGQQAPSGPCWARAGGGSSDGGGSGGGGTHHTVAGAAACCDVSDAALRCIVGGAGRQKGGPQAAATTPAFQKRTCTSCQPLQPIVTCCRAWLRRRWRLPQRAGPRRPRRPRRRLAAAPGS